MDIGDFFRKATRPAVTVIFAATIAQVVTQGIDAPDWFLIMANIVIIEWWSERAIKRIKSKTPSPLTGEGQGEGEINVARGLVPRQR